jgi:hypothetical protein
MKGFRAFLSVVLLMFVAATLIPCSAQTAKAQDAGVDVQTHKFVPKGPVGQLPPGAQSMAAQKPQSGISATAIAQINALQQEKQSRTPVQKKIDSQVLATSRMMQNQPVADGIQYVYTDVDLDQDDNLVVDITAEVSDDLIKQMTAAGAKIIYSNAKYRSVRAAVPSTALETVAGLPGVVFVSRKQEAMTVGMIGAPAQSLPRTPFMAPGFAQRAANLRAFLTSTLAMRSPFTPLLSLGAGTNIFNSGQGSVASEGDVTHRAFEVRNAFGVDGTGIKIGVLSDGVKSLALSQASGDLGTVTVLPGQDGVAGCTASNALTCDEGTAMLEIVHDLAPGAQLYFATAFNGVASFAQNIHDLRTAGCDIIVDDVFYYAETPFQDGQAPSVVSSTNGGLIAQAVNDVTADGAMYFSSAGNSGNMDDSTSGTWEGDFVNGGTLSLIGTDAIHQFGTNLYDTIKSSGGPITLYWADPLGGPASDYDLYVLDSTGSAIMAASWNDQSVAGTDPFEYVSSTTDVTGNRIVVSQYAGSDRFFHLDNNRGTLTVATAGQVHGHNTALNAYSVAATPALNPYYSNLPMGPYPNYFSGANVVEGFSSDGPRRLFFAADGTPITPGNFSSTGGVVRQKPDITAADGVSVTGVGGFGSPFYGTSAAAPHAAAIAALVKAAKPTLTNDQIRTALTSTAIDIMGAGVDRDSGAGILNAFEAVRSLGVVGVANPDIATVTATENPGNGNGVLEAGEGGKLVIQLRNTGGVADATNIMATLTTSTPGVFIPTPNTSAYANLAALTGTGTNLTPFTFTLASDYPCGQPIAFKLTLNYTGGPGPRDLTFNVSTEPPPVNINTVLDTTAPVVLPPLTGSTGTQNARLFRTGVPSVCGTAKPFPGLGGFAGLRQYDAYTFTACRDACVDVTTTTTNGSSVLYTSAYTPVFTPGDLSAGFAGDAGFSYYQTEFGVSATAGNSYTVVVNEVDPAGGVGTNYNVQISGCAVNCSPLNHVPVAKAKDVTVTVDASGTAAASVDNGSSDADGDTLTITQTPASPYPIGVTPVTLTVVDPKGATSQANANVTVLDVPVTVAVQSGMIWTTGASLTKTVGTITHTVGKASDLTATITWGDGTANSTGTVSGTAPTFTVTGTHTYAAVGTPTITVSIQDVHGGTDVKTASVSVANADFGFTGTIATTTVKAGQSGAPQFTITPNPAPFNSAISLSCTGAPTSATCTPSQASVTPGTNSVTVTLNITTAGSAKSQLLRRTSPIYASLVFSGLGLIGMFAIGKRKSNRKARVALTLLLLILMSLMLVNCGGGNSSNTTTTSGASTPAGTYTLTVTAISGSTSHTTTATLVVQ